VRGWGTHLFITRRHKTAQKCRKNTTRHLKMLPDTITGHLYAAICLWSDIGGHDMPFMVWHYAKVLRFNALRFAAAFCPVLCGAPLPNERTAPNLTENGTKRHKNPKKASRTAKHADTRQNRQNGRVKDAVCSLL